MYARPDKGPTERTGRSWGSRFRAFRGFPVKLARERQTFVV